jgi:hypothetical protein
MGLPWVSTSSLTESVPEESSTTSKDELRPLVGDESEEDSLASVWGK